VNRTAKSQAGPERDLVGTPDLVLAGLACRGLHRVHCEGGPALFGELVAADAIDELCLTVAPLLVGGTAGRIAMCPESEHRHKLELADALHEDDVLTSTARTNRPSAARDSDKPASAVRSRAKSIRPQFTAS
jgi:riboflavin biosynthesis pyrimidine reductase